jgi:hypothetical protein
MIERRWGRVVCVTGTAEPAQVNVAVAANAGVHAWAKGLSREIAKHGVTPNCVGPGRVHSEVERTIDAAARLLILTVSGKLEDGDLLSLTEYVANVPGITPDFSFLIDLRQADGTTVTPVGVRLLARQRLVLSPESRRAVVVPTDLGYGMARMYEILRERRGGATVVLRDYDDAERWVRTGVRSSD